MIPASVIYVHDDALKDCPNLRVVLPEDAALRLKVLLTQDPSQQLPPHLEKIRRDPFDWLPSDEHSKRLSSSFESMSGVRTEPTSMCRLATSLDIWAKETAVVVAM